MPVAGLSPLPAFRVTPSYLTISSPPLKSKFPIFSHVTVSAVSPQVMLYLYQALVLLNGFALFCFYSSNSNDILEVSSKKIRVSQSTGLDYSLPVIGCVPVRIEVDAHWLRQTGAEPGIFSQKLVPV